MKIQLTNIDDALECPFYVKAGKKHTCFMKLNMSAGQAINLVDNSDFDATTWNDNCEGKFENCSFVNLLYKIDTEPATAVQSEEYEDFNPFEEYEDEDDETQPKPEKQPEIAPEDLIHVRVHPVDNIYSVKVDALIYPNNQMLLIDDEELNYRSQDRIQAELNKIAPPVAMGSVFKTSNGGEHKGGVVPKIIYHAVVAAQSRLVSEAAISKATIKSLTQADEDGCKIIAMMPMDCGNFDLHQTANAQLNAIYKFLQTVATKNIRHIFIITTKNDKVTLDIFNEKFDRIFGEE